MVEALVLRISLKFDLVGCFVREGDFHPLAAVQPLQLDVARLPSDGQACAENAEQGSD